MPAGFAPVDGVPVAPELSVLFEPLSLELVVLDEELLLLSLLAESVVGFFCVLL